MLRWGILSTANIGINHVIPAILNSDNGVVQAIASRNIARSKSAAKRFGVPQAFGNYDELLANPYIDAIYVPLITSAHVEWSVRAADAGKHVLCEKPIALHASQIDRLTEASSRNGVLISEAFMVSYHPQWLKVRELVRSGAIGQLQQVQAAFTYFNTDPANMRNQKDQGGGALLDIGVYPVVTTRFVTGIEPRLAHADITFDPTFGTDTHASARIDFGGFELSMYVSTQMALRQSIVFHGDKGWIEVDSPFNAGIYADQCVRHYNQDRDEIKAFRFPGTNHYQLQVEAFARQVRGEGQPDGIEVFSLENSKNNQKVIDAIFKAAESGNWAEV